VKAIHSATLDPLPELEAPSEAREAPVAPSEDENRGVLGLLHLDPQEPSERRSWLYRFFSSGRAVSRW
jgi:hypothetical protein